MSELAHSTGGRGKKDPPHVTRNPYPPETKRKVAPLPLASQTHNNGGTPPDLSPKNSPKHSPKSVQRDEEREKNSPSSSPRHGKHKGAQVPKSEPITIRAPDDASQAFGTSV
jgi:hypothetical protein